MSFQDIRRKQISEVIDLDKSISRKVFDLEFQNVKESEDVYKVKPKNEKIFYEVTNYINAILDDTVGTIEDIQSQPWDYKARQESVISGIKDYEIPLVDWGRSIYKWNMMINYLTNLNKFYQLSEKERDDIYTILDSDLLPQLINLKKVIDKKAYDFNIKPDNILIEYSDLLEMIEKIENKNLSVIRSKKQNIYEDLKIKYQNEEDESTKKMKSDIDFFKKRKGALEELEEYDLDELSEYYRDLLKAREKVQMGEKVEEGDLDEINEKLAMILQDERAAEFPQLYGEGKKNMIKSKYSKVRNMNFDDSRNDFYKK